MVATGEVHSVSHKEPVTPVSDDGSDTYSPQSDQEEDTAHQFCERSKRFVERGEQSIQSASSRGTKKSSALEASKTGGRVDNRGSYQVSNPNKYPNAAQDGKPKGK
jgi:hypothetical protein